MDAEFAAAALQLFYSQSRNNPVYAQYISYLGVNPENVSDIWHIPFLPVQFFKTHEVISGGTKANECDAVFTSSGTTGMSTSRHYVKDIEVYYQSLEKGFTEFYGSPQNYTILALLPSYLERKGSSLIVMAQRLMQLSQQEGDGFFLYDFAALHNRINREIAAGKRVLLIGVTFALMDFAREFPAHYGNDVIIMETGGMKGRRKELTRYEVHAYLTERLGVTAIHSEYGMTELLSQAYSNGGGIYRPSSTMRVTNAPASRERRRRRLELAKGFYGARSKLFRTATEAVDRAMRLSTEHRKLRKREFRQLWIARVNAAARAEGISYSKFMAGLIKAGVTLNRKMLSEIAIQDPAGFKVLVDVAKKA